MFVVCVYVYSRIANTLGGVMEWGECFSVEFVDEWDWYPVYVNFTPLYIHISCHLCHYQTTNLSTPSVRSPINSLGELNVTNEF